MDIKAKLAKEEYDHNKDSETHLLVELEAPKIDISDERAPICVVPVIDVSGSMRGDKLDYVKKACRKLMDNLSVGDFAGVVSFDTIVYPVAEIREITQYQKDDLKKQISEMHSGSCTNMSGGILTGLKWINEMDLPDKVALRVILFTDGHANSGVVGRDLLKFVEKNKGRATLSAFGFGVDCDQELLADMANIGDGNFAYVDSPDAAVSAFARELGGLLATHAQDIRVSIKPDKNNKVLEILNDEDVSEKDGITTISIRDILGEEKKWVVAKVQVSEVDKPFPRKVNAFKVNVTYSDRDGDEQSLEEVPVKVKLCKPGEEKAEEDGDVVKQRDRLIAASAQTQAEQFARDGDYAKASFVLQDCSMRLGDADIKGVMDSMSVSYSSAGNYTSSRGLTNSVRNVLRGKRVVSTSKEAKNLCNTVDSQTSKNMDDMEESFKNTTETSSGDAVIYTTTTGNAHKEDKSVKKKRSGKDW